MGNTKGKQNSNNNDKSIKSPSSTSPLSSSSRFGRNIGRQRFNNNNIKNNNSNNNNNNVLSNNDLMFEFIRNCSINKNLENNLSSFYILINKLLINIDKFDHQITNNKNNNNNIICDERIRNKKIIRSMRLIHGWMTLAINHNKYWIFSEMGLILKRMYDRHNNNIYNNLYIDSNNNNNNNNNRIIIDYERIMGDLLCLCTLKKRFLMIKYMVEILKIDVNLTCEGGETPLIICAEHNLPDITLYLLSSGADANCNNYLLSDSSNSPAQISASWQHLKVLYYLIIYGAKTKYLNIHLRSVEQYAKDNHLINYIVQKALNKRIIRNKNIKRILNKMLLHPIEYKYYYSNSNSNNNYDTDNGYSSDDSLSNISTSQSIEIDFQFPIEDNMINFNINFGDNNHIDNQIKSNINKSIQFIKKTKSKTKIIKTKTRKKSNTSNNNNYNNIYHENRVYLIKPIVSIIYSMII